MLTNPITVIGVRLGLAHVQQIKPASVLKLSAHLIVVIFFNCALTLFSMIKMMYPQVIISPQMS